MGWEWFSDVYRLSVLFDADGPILAPAWTIENQIYSQAEK